MLARATNARAMIGFGTSLDISTLHLAAALRDNGGGKLITTEFEATKIARARANIAASGLADLAEVREGDALACTVQARLLMKGKTVVITGGTSGIGEVAAISLAQVGARIILVARNRSRAEATLARLRADVGQRAGVGRGIGVGWRARGTDQHLVPAAVDHSLSRGMMRLVRVKSETIRPPQTEAIRSSFVTTRSRFSMR